MAIDARIHFHTLAHWSDYPENISPQFFHKLGKTDVFGRNCDGELLGSGRSLEELITLGFNGPDHEFSQCCLNRTDIGYPEWIEGLWIIPHDTSVKPFEAFGLKGGRSNFVQCSWTQLFYVRDIKCSWKNRKVPRALPHNVVSIKRRHVTTRSNFK